MPRHCFSQGVTSFSSAIVLLPQHSCSSCALPLAHALFAGG